MKKLRSVYVVFLSAGGRVEIKLKLATLRPSVLYFLIYFAANVCGRADERKNCVVLPQESCYTVYGGYASGMCGAILFSRDGSAVGTTGGSVRHDPHSSSSKLTTFSLGSMSAGASC